MCSWDVSRHWITLCDLNILGSREGQGFSCMPAPSHPSQHPLSSRYTLLYKQTLQSVCTASFSLLEDHVCLLDCIALDLQEMDVFAAECLPCQPLDNGGKPPNSSDLIFPSYSVHRTGDSLLKDRCHLKLKVERNLDKWAPHFYIWFINKIR